MLCCTHKKSVGRKYKAICGNINEERKKAKKKKQEEKQMTVFNLLISSTPHKVSLH